MNQPLLSVLVLTYNHERFIGDALTSALNQKTDFPYEIVIGEDHSTDRTRHIVQEFARLHPDRIRALLENRNIGVNSNFWRTYAACRGEFIAPLDGDDYWTCMHKLQLQIDYLKSHPECVASFHDAQAVDSEGRSLGRRIPEKVPGEKLTFTDLLRTNYPTSLSIVYRRQQWPGISSHFNGIAMLDWPLNLLLTRKGSFGHIPKEMGAYRWHAGGVWSLTSEVARCRTIEQMLRVWLKLAVETELPSVGARRKENLVWMMQAAEKAGDRRAMRWALRRYWLASPHPFQLPPHRRRLIARAFLPWIRLRLLDGS